MPQGRGRIVNMASGAGLAGSAGMAAYSASKHAVVGLTRSLAREVADAGIQVNAVCPGLRRLADDGAHRDAPGRACRHRSGVVRAVDPGWAATRDPAEVGELVAWLALEAPAYVNGSTQVIDGALRA